MNYYIVYFFDGKIIQIDSFNDKESFKKREAIVKGRIPDYLYTSEGRAFNETQSHMELKS